MDWEEMYDLLLTIEGVTENALELGFAIGGCNEEEWL